MLPYDEQGIINRFLEEVARIIQEGKVKKQVDFALSLGKHRSLVNDIRKGRCKITAEILVLSRNLYSMDVYYVLFNERTVYLDKTIDLSLLDQRGRFRS